MTIQEVRQRWQRANWRSRDIARDALTDKGVRWAEQLRHLADAVEQYAKEQNEWRSANTFGPAEQKAGAAE